MSIKQFNNPTSGFRNVFNRAQKFDSTGGGVGAPTLPPMEASGGVTAQYSTPTGVVYQSHTFNNSGSFVVSNIGPGAVDILVVGGGGGGGNDNGGGGAAGGLHYKSAYVLPAEATYPVVIGAGGAADMNGGIPGLKGEDTVFSSPTTALITATGGGFGAGDTNPGGPAGGPGGSGGGGGMGNNAPSYGGGEGTGAPGHPGAADQASPPLGWGNDGGMGAPYSPGGIGGGGGGAGSVGASHPQPTQAAGGKGGSGVAYTIQNGSNQYYAAGGGGGGTPGPGGEGGDPQTAVYLTADPTIQVPIGGFGAAQGSNVAPGSPTPLGPYEGYSGTGSGGGGGYPSSGPGGSGSPGTVIVRYRIASTTGTAKASGGAVSFYGGKTIHTFTGSGTIVYPGPFSETIEYVVIAGGGGGAQVFGGAGAGAVMTGTMAETGPNTRKIAVGAGGNGTSYIGNTGGSATNYAGKGFESEYAGASTKDAEGGGQGVTGPGPGGEGGDGGSGGGGSDWGGSDAAGGDGTGDTFPGTIGATPTNGWGNNGGEGNSGDKGGGGGGGAGAVGQDGQPTRGGDGGAGIQLPATFRNPETFTYGTGPTSAPTPNGFDTTGKFWVAGGGGGGSWSGPTGASGGPSGGGGGGAPAPMMQAGEGYAGGGSGGLISPTATGGAPTPTNNGLCSGKDGELNTGGGGGAGSRNNQEVRGGHGGSGVVLIAYPT